MKSLIIKTNIPRREVIEFYVNYDGRKKRVSTSLDFATWNWVSADELDTKLAERKLKCGVLPAYRLWWFLEISLEDLLECAIVNHIFPGRPQVLSQLCMTGELERWKPNGDKDWFAALERGDSFPPEWAMILRPSTHGEFPAKWYIEDGSGRALSMVRRFLRHTESWRTAYAYLGVVPDERSQFMRLHPELKAELT